MMVLSRIRALMLESALEVIPNVYQLNIRAINIIVIAEEELTIIDTGLRGSSARIIDFIHSLGRSVEEISLIILTHNHFDHAGGLAFSIFDDKMVSPSFIAPGVLWVSPIRQTPLRNWG